MYEERHECREIYDADFIQVYVGDEVVFDISRDDTNFVGDDDRLKVELHEYTTDGEDEDDADV